MITSSKKVGRPKGKTAPKSQAELYKKSMEKLINAGGARLNTILHGDDISALTRFKEMYDLPPKTSNAEVIRILIMLIDGKKYQLTGGELIATVKKVSR
ncbi:TPA: hypothetical protein N5N91_004641 [Enterobacter roggenkampii]|nr:hypothetical protein [Enterobacter roggenkampii]